MMLCAANMKYDEVWAPRGKEWIERRTGGEFPFDQLPVVDFDGKRLAQSGAINRYVAHLTGFMPEDPWDQALAGQAFDATQELEGAMPLVNLLTGERFAEMRSKYMKRLPRRLDNFSRALGSRPFLVNDRLSYADFGLHFVLNLTTLIEPRALDSHHELAEFVERVGSSSQGVKDYLDARPTPVGIGTEPRME
uniref:Glutathione transferase n=1 Tax=Hemiselmis andersenii TaxID=464988 RepID=A0A7S1H0L4_HEMAN|mmetsp:Transcript_31310/g.76372  ORF Transcript_31310/g.76372 Transcript_31310/m.76372 type:complete len:193 (+) Transcript_31310:3-581(+)